MNLTVEHWKKQEELLTEIKRELHELTETLNRAVKILEFKEGLRREP